MNAQSPRGLLEQQQSTAKLQEKQAPRQGMRRQVVMLCFVHVIISWAFFIFQASLFSTSRCLAGK